MAAEGMTCDGYNQSTGKTELQQHATRVRVILGANAFGIMMGVQIDPSPSRDQDFLEMVLAFIVFTGQ